MAVDLWALDILRSRNESPYILSSWIDILGWIELHVGYEGSIVFVGWEKFFVVSLIEQCGSRTLVPYGEYPLLASGLATLLLCK